ncbi:MAG: hypothetical protein WB784_04410 [Rhodanobacteraceae bacterium]
MKAGTVLSLLGIAVVAIIAVQIDFSPSPISHKKPIRIPRAPAPKPLTAEQKWRKHHEEQIAALYAADAAERLKAANEEVAARCRHEVTCYAKPYEIDAEMACEKQIESQAKWQYEWTDGWLGPSKFSGMLWGDEQAGTFTLVGNHIKMQNGFGAWRMMQYVCVYNPAVQVATAVVEPIH